jgi:hypothetical protein
VAARARSASGFNVTALCLVDTAEHGLARFVVEEPDKAQETLEQCGIPYGVAKALSLELPNTPGALSAIARRLGEGKVNIDYAYGSATNRDPARAILGVSNLAKAQSILSGE